MESFQEGNKRYYNLQVCLDTSTGVPEISFNIRTTETQVQDGTAPKTPTVLLDIPPAVIITDIPNEAFDTTLGRTPRQVPRRNVGKFK